MRHILHFPEPPPRGNRTVQRCSKCGTVLGSNGGFWREGYSVMESTDGPTRCFVEAVYTPGTEPPYEGCVEIKYRELEFAR